MNNEMLLARRRILFAKGSSNTLLRIAEAEVSMLTIDGSDGKGNEFILNAVSDDGQPMRGIRWISQDTSIATVTSNGDGLTATVRGVGIGAASLGADVLIYASHNGVVKECLFTIYNTLPSADVEGAGLWAIKGGQGDGIEVYFRTYNVPTESLTYVYMDYSAMYTLPRYYNSAFRPISSTAYNYPVIIYDNALRYSRRIATVNGASYSFTDYKTAYTITPSIKSRHKILLNSGLFVNDVQQSLSFFSASDQQTTPNNAVIIFDGSQKKIINAIASNNSINMSDLTSPLMSYICQNYVKFTDYDSYVNRTKILNMGTLGHSYDMEANNVPETWFNI